MADQDFTLTQEYLQSIFDYKDGELYWKKKTSKESNISIGDKAGSKNNHGYIQVYIKNKLYKVHRVIFLMHHGYLPTYIDHINCIKNDNRIENLRPATKSQNAINTKTRKNNTSNAKNVYWHKASKKWFVQLTVNGKQKSFGYYHDFELAELVAIEARDKYHGKFSNSL